MSVLRALRALVLGETWRLPIGLAVVLLAAAEVVRPLVGDRWPQLGGFVLAAGVVGVLSIGLGRRG